MWPWINACVAAVAANPEIALLVAFLGAVIEAVALIGIVVPGTPVMMAVAGAAAMAGQDMRPFLAVGIAGAVIGDGISFLIGRRYSVRLRRLWPLSRRPALLARADGFFARYGMASIALCRFVPFLRSTVPLVAGMAGMQWGRFLLANVLSACVWAPLHVYPAQLAGMSLERLQDGDWQSAAAWAAALLGCAAAALCVHRAILSRSR